MIWKNVYSRKFIFPERIKQPKDWLQKQVDFVRTIPFENFELLEKNNSLLLSLIEDGNQVIDYGGALGGTYLVSKSKADISFYVVETKEMCKKGNELFLNNQNIEFLYKIKHCPPCDISYARSSLQYSKNWKKTLKRLIKKCEILVLAHTSTGDIPTYKTLQNMGKYKVPYWFLNFKELKEYVESFGYILTYKSPHEYLRSELYTNIPKTHIINHTLDLVFQKK